MQGTRPIEFLEPAAPPVLGKVARTILDVAVGQPSDQIVSLSPNEFQQAVDFAMRHRVGSFLNAALESGSVAIPPGSKPGQLKKAQSGSALWQLKLASVQRDVVRDLQANNIDVRILKGLATARLDHSNGGRRQTSDVDLLVQPHDFDQACEVVAGAAAREVKTGRPAGLLVERTFVTADRVEIDLHHRLFRFGRDPDGLLFERPADIGEKLGCALPVEGRLMHAAAHLLIAAPGTRHLSSLVDVAVISASGHVDEQRLSKLCRHFGVEGLTTLSVWLAENVGLEQPAPPPKLATSIINRAYVRTTRSVPLETLAVLQDLQARDWPSYLGFQIKKLAAKAD